MKYEISQSEYIYKIHQLVHLAEINFLVCQKIYKDYLSKKGRHENTFFVLTANNAFHESLSTLQTLICSTEKNDLKIKPVLEKIIAEEKKDFVDKIDNERASEFLASINRDYPYLGEQTLYSYKTFLFKENEDDTMLGQIMADIRSKRRIENGLKDFDDLKEKFEKYNFHKIRHHQVGHKHKDLKEPAGSVDLLLQDQLIQNLADVIKDLKIKTNFWFNFSFGNPDYSILDNLDKVLKD